MATTLPTRVLTFDDVMRMVEAGILAEHERVELLEGVLVQMSPEGTEHKEVVRLLTRALNRLYPDPFGPYVQSTLYLDETTFLQPDIVATRTGPLFDRWPTPEETLLVVEVALTSAAYDRGDKARRYARWGAARYWVVDLGRREVVVHTRSAPDGYASLQVVDETGALPLPELEQTLAVASILPPRG